MNATRKIRYSMPRRCRVGKMVGGQSTIYSVKGQHRWCYPSHFRIFLMSIPQMIVAFTGANVGTGIGATLIGMLSQNNWFNFSHPVYSIGLVLYIVLNVFFAYFYTSITFNPIEVADNMKKQGGFIPGIRPGKRRRNIWKRL